MRKHLFFTLATLISFSFLVASAQERNPSTYEPGKRAQGAFVELLGPGLTYSFNYDTRFQNTLNGLGGRAGISYLAVEGNSVLTVPLMINYLLGKEGRYFEMGVGGTYMGFTANKDNEEILFIDGSGVTGTMTFGYRSQPTNGGFMFRAGISPIFNKNNFIPYYGYLSLGYAF